MQEALFLPAAMQSLLDLSSGRLQCLQLARHGTRPRRLLSGALPIRNPAHLIGCEQPEHVGERAAFHSRALALT